MTPKDTLKTLAIKIESEITRLITQEVKTSEGISPYIQELLKYINFVTKGGKRLRGGLVMISYKLCGGKNEEEILKIAVALELAHTYLLIHDDIMDNANYRHGIQTMHKTYAQIHKSLYDPKGSKHFGVGIAICAGDIINHLSQKIFLETDFEPKLKIKALEFFQRKFIDVGYGQVLDALSEVRQSVTEKDILQVHEYKTGCYTFETPLRIGAILAGVNGEHARVLTEYAIPSGIAYQLHDDVLGMFGNEKVLGKPADSDLKEGKRTTLILKALEKSDTNQKLIIENALGNKNLSEDTLEAVRTIIKDTGSLAYTEKLCKKFVQQAKDAIKDFKTSHKEEKDFLIGITDYFIEREK